MADTPKRRDDLSSRDAAGRAKPPIVSVSDHAVVRYLERVGGIDIEALRSQIAARVQYAAELGAAKVKIDGHAYIIQDFVVTTVVPQHHDFPKVRE